MVPLIQIRRGDRDNLGKISHILHKNIFCDLSLEPSYRDGSNEGSQSMFSLRNKKNYLRFIFNTRSCLELCGTEGHQIHPEPATGNFGHLWHLQEPAGTCCGR